METKCYVHRKYIRKYKHTKRICTLNLSYHENTSHHIETKSYVHRKYIMKYKNKK